MNARKFHSRWSRRANIVLSRQTFLLSMLCYFLRNLYLLLFTSFRISPGDTTLLAIDLFRYPCLLVFPTDQWPESNGYLRLLVISSTINIMSSSRVRHPICLLKGVIAHILEPPVPRPSAVGPLTAMEIFQRNPCTLPLHVDSTVVSSSARHVRDTGNGRSQSCREA